MVRDRLRAQGQWRFLVLVIVNRRLNERQFVGIEHKLGVLGFG
jgi:hypothetical protein